MLGYFQRHRASLHRTAGGEVDDEAEAVEASMMSDVDLKRNLVRDKRQTLLY